MLMVWYQDDWLKTSASSLQLWEKAHLEPYTLQKPMTYYVVCPDINPLTTAAADFFQQLGTGSVACPNAATAGAQFLRAEMLLSGYFIRPCKDGGSIIHKVDIAYAVETGQGSERVMYGFTILFVSVVWNMLGGCPVTFCPLFCSILIAVLLGFVGLFDWFMYGSRGAQDG
ncbi:Mediator of RNA polymerase II transcription subunit 13 [Camellia lanceoleosa]|uniref:Mediator of RNA polymerase II transcription subunit 13 n=1 Tax=Camellia lanceoleosa TaxID=1840588 RepID=A0ACC0H628_9ERIC|nr:Mediator of RNA polymerase II transcription subunit 13 [Camellia lanceoleosa]